MLTFLGRGSAFADKHNCAYFKDGTDLILIDCSASLMKELKMLDKDGINHVYVLVTHFHGDHISGIGTYARMVYWPDPEHKTKFTVVLPTEQMKTKMENYLETEGCGHYEFSTITAADLNKPWLNKAILTEHDDLLPKECFGYDLTVNKKHIVYTGDTRIIEPFISDLKPGDYLYTECAVVTSSLT